MVNNSQTVPRKQIIIIFAFVAFIFLINSQKESGTIYILFWTVIKDQKWNYRNLNAEKGKEAFVRRNCSFQNCYLTTNRRHLNSILDFDVLMFNTVHLSQGYPWEYMPKQRSVSQLYVLFSVEPAAYTSIPLLYDGIFNVTWTYVLKSDIVHPYFFVKDNFSEIIAPKIVTHWMDVKNLPPIHPNIERKLQRKSIAALWVVSNCGPQKRLIFAHSLNDKLSTYGHRVDIYGRCGDQSGCKKNPLDKKGLLTNCFSKIESDYYFVLAFENTFTEDYVSEKILHALQHFSVPIVYGGANYTRFLPDGIYLNAMELGVEGLAKEMNNIINDPQRYYDFFKWHDYYSFHDSSADDYRESVCAFCSFLNNRTKNNKIQIYKNITGWWNGPYPDLYPNTAYTDRHTTTLKPEEIIESQLEDPPPSPISSVFTKIIDLFLDYN